MFNFFEVKNCQNNRGFSLLEVLMGITVFMIGMLGVTALSISSLKSNTFSGNMSEATILASHKIEELMALDFKHDDLTDTDGDGTEEDPPPDNDGVDESGGNFGLDDIGTGADEADHFDLGVGKNSIYDIYWNVAVGEPLPKRTKTINVIVEWEMKEVKRQMNLYSILVKDEAE